MMTEGTVLASEEEKVAELLRLFDSFRSYDGSDEASSCSCSVDELRAADARHRAHIVQLAAKSNAIYADDGNPVLFAFIGSGRNRMCGYRWEPPQARGASDPHHTTQSDQPNTHEIRWSKNYIEIDWSKVRGIIIHAHGITESARTGLLRCRATSLVLGDTDHLHVDKLTADQQNALKEKTNNENGHYAAYERSWVDAITKAGFVLYTCDHQGHGYSQGWRGERCNVERLLNLERDLINLTRTLVLSGEVPSTTPVYLTGLSLGGLITLRAVQIGFREKLLCTGGSCQAQTPKISGIGLFCPAISGERLKKKFPNQFLLPITKILSRVSPSARLVALEDARPYAFLSPMIALDPMIYNGKLPIRISAESVDEMDLILPNLDSIPQDLSILLVQSKHDTMTDPEGSAKFMELVHCIDKKVHWLDYSWHWLAREPGYGATCQVFIDWLNARTSLPL